MTTVVVRPFSNNPSKVLVNTYSGCFMREYILSWSDLFGMLKVSEDITVEIK